jgi:hypothetical protein
MLLALKCQTRRQENSAGTAVNLKGSAMQQNAANQPTPGIKREIVYRVQIAMFWYLCLLFGNTILHPVTDGVLYATVSALFELFIIQAMLGLFGDTPLVRDANELNFYAFLIHLAAIPMFLFGVPSSYHNNAINGMVLFYLIRIFYFGEKRDDGEYKGWTTFGALGVAYRIIMKHGNGPITKHFVFVGKAVITLGTIIPLWLITIQTNTQQTSLFTILSTSFILIYGYWKNSMANHHAANAATQAAATKGVSAATRARVLRLVRRARREVAEMRGYIKFLYCASALIFICLLAVTEGTIRRDTIFSYATGYIDAKTGKLPRAGTDIQELMKCFDINGAGKPPPPTKECRDMTNFKP